MKIEKYNIIKGTIDNFEDYYQIRSEKKNLFWTGYEKAPEYDSFLNWFKNRLLDKNREIYLLFIDKKCAGSLHIDYYIDYAAIGYSIKTVYEGKGIGTLLVNESIRIIKEEKVVRSSLMSIKAWINCENIASQKIVIKNGFSQIDNNLTKIRFGKEEEYLEYVINI